MQLFIEEWDILRSPTHDLSRDEAQQALLKRVSAGEFDYIFMSPPCNTWTRAVHSNPWVPRPLRNRQWPRGFPWLEGSLSDTARLGNVLVDFCFTICHVVSKPDFPCSVRVSCEHPEDLGLTFNLQGRPVYPASIWQLPEFWDLLHQSTSWVTVAFFQCRFNIDRLKPTRLLANIPAITSDHLRSMMKEYTPILYLTHVLMAAILLLLSNALRTISPPLAPAFIHLPWISLWQQSLSAIFPPFALAEGVKLRWKKERAQKLGTS